MFTVQAKVCIDWWIVLIQWSIYMTTDTGCRCVCERVCMCERERRERECVCVRMCLSVMCESVCMCNHIYINIDAYTH